MLKQLTYRTIWSLGEKMTVIGRRVRAWAWNRIIREWPAEIACDILRGLDGMGCDDDVR